MESRGNLVVSEIPHTASVPHILHLSKGSTVKRHHTKIGEFTKSLRRKMHVARLPGKSWLAHVEAVRCMRGDLWVDYVGT